MRCTAPGQEIHLSMSVRRFVIASHIPSRRDCIETMMQDRGTLFITTAPPATEQFQLVIFLSLNQIPILQLLFDSHRRYLPRLHIVEINPNYRKDTMELMIFVMPKSAFITVTQYKGRNVSKHSLFFVKFVLYQY